MPINISKENIISAINEINTSTNRIPPSRASVLYDLEYNGKLYPPKYVISIANKYANGTELSPNDFTAAEARNKLIELGFNVIKKGDGKLTDNSLYNEDKNVPKNLILYGPPGTGKTYNVINKALEAVDYNKYKLLINDPTKRSELVAEYKNLVNKGQIAFCTFHQSYSYEEFIEGLRSDENGTFTPRDGIFKQICQSAKPKESGKITTYDFKEDKINFFKMSLVDDSAGGDYIFEYCIKKDVVSLGWGGDIDYKDCDDKAKVREKFLSSNPDRKSNDFNIEAIERFKNWMNKGDLILISSGNHKIRAIAKVDGDYYFDQDTDITFCHFRKVKWLFSGDPIPVSHFLKNKVLSQQAIYMFATQDLIIENIRELITKNSGSNNKTDNYVLIIDEINRGNISKIFGELITLIESDKRAGETNELTAILPYTNETFSVPSNLYIIGTMNTADRSIALLDTAIRRRFEFIECMPRPELIDVNIEDINVSQFLSTINKRIEFLLDRDHTIGHAYFMDKDLDFGKLKDIMIKKVIPLLQEYFYDNWENIERILGGAGKMGDNNYFLNKEEVQPGSLFGEKLMDVLEPKFKYTIVENPSINAFLNITNNI
ncbi:MAG: AAA family ATPase [Sedimentibacter sp.]|uniref:AAA family ATPase n=1 Tax=Sedimentibacter sp. TaxID=1960295 RepID=UPI002981B218|nr:AAA family ATPase [Sedimentibacter sp.]MDW5300425.1 AAA family ATPase [Sedimentibacter sp.]